MKKTMMTIAAGMLMAGGLFAQNITGREIHQQARIGQGIHTGQLTHRETRAIEAREFALSREIRHDRLTGGGLSCAERARIGRQQNHLSHEIYVLKHNGRARW